MPLKWTLFGSCLILVNASILLTNQLPIVGTKISVCVYMKRLVDFSRFVSNYWFSYSSHLISCCCSNRKIPLLNDQLIQIRRCRVVIYTYIMFSSTRTYIPQTKASFKKKKNSNKNNVLVKIPITAFLIWTECVLALMKHILPLNQLKLFEFKSIFVKMKKKQMERKI